MGVSDRRIVLLGKTGSGKSSLANTIFGEELFKIDHSANSGTSKCEAETKTVNGRSITLVDCPGFFDTERSEKELKPEIVRCIIECAPGPHAFLIVLKVEKFTEQEQAVVHKINEYVSEKAFKYATVVFTHGDQLPEGQTIEDFVHQNKHLSDLVKKCGGRCLVVDNKHWNQKPKEDYRSNQFQVEKLLNTIEEMVTENKGCFYTNEMLQALKEAKANGSTKFWAILKGFGIGVLIGALVGAVLVCSTVIPAPGLAVVVVCAVVGGALGGIIGYFVAGGEDLTEEAKEAAVEKAMQDSPHIFKASYFMEKYAHKILLFCGQ